jgi:hypothetical protein
MMQVELSELPSGDALMRWLPEAVGGLLALLFLWLSMRARRKKRLIEDLPTSKTQGVFIGFVELKGTAQSRRPLTSHLAEQPCVTYTWSVEEHWSRWVRETYRDSKGRTRTRMRHESGWKTVADGGEMIRFDLEDDTGKIRVHPEGAKIEAAQVFEKTCGRGDPLYYAKGPEFAVADSDHRRRFAEWAIPVGSALYVMGQAREREDVVAPEIAQDPEAPMFLISTRSEHQVSSGYLWAAWGWTFLALLFALGGAFIGSDVLTNDAVVPAEVLPRALGIAGGTFAAAWMLWWVWTVYNSLVELRQRVRQASSLVDVQLKRRSDLIPNLVALVQGFKDHEKTVQEEVARLRTQAGATRPGEPGPDPSACARTILAIVERYPDLKANESFLKLQEDLTDTEQRIALARAYFNDIATFYNTRLEVVPDRFVAALGRLRPATLWTASDFERASVTVEMEEAG